MKNFKNYNFDPESLYAALVPNVPIKNFSPYRSQFVFVKDQGSESKLWATLLTGALGAAIVILYIAAAFI